MKFASFRDLQPAKHSSPQNVWIADDLNAKFAAVNPVFLNAQLPTMSNVSPVKLALLNRSTLISFESSVNADVPMCLTFLPRFTPVRLVQP